MPKGQEREGVLEVPPSSGLRPPSPEGRRGKRKN